LRKAPHRLRRRSRRSRRASGQCSVASRWRSCRWGERFALLRVGKAVGATVGRARRAALPAAGVVERMDGMLQRWPAAGLALLAMTLLFGAALLPVAR